MTDFDHQRAILEKPDWFVRFNVVDRGVPLSQCSLRPDEKLLVFQRGEQRRALLRSQMTYHHVAQGELDEQPFVVTF